MVYFECILKDGGAFFSRKKGCSVLDKYVEGVPFVYESGY